MSTIHCLLKTLWEKEKSLITSNFSFSHRVFCPLTLSQTSNFTFFHNVFYAICISKSFDSHILVIICSFFEFGTVTKWCIREWVNPFPYNYNFWRVWERSLLKKIVGKGEISPFPSMYSTLSKTEMTIFVTFKLSYANAFNLVWSKILSCGNVLKLYNV